MPHERLTWPQVIKTLIYKDPHYWAVWSAKILTTVLSTNIDDDIVKNSLTPLLYWHDWPVGNCRPLQLLIICPSIGLGREPGQRKYSLSFISTFTMLYQLAAEPHNLEHWGCCEPRICSSGEQIFYSKRKPSTLENKYWAGMVDGSLYWEWNLSEVSEESVNQGVEPLKWFI